MSYITQTDIENKFGDANVRVWSNLDNTSSSVNATRIAEAIAWAEAYIDDRFRASRYVVPFVPVPEVVKDWASILAGTWLYFCRGQRDEDTDNKYHQMKREAAKDMAAYLTGQRHFPAANYRSSYLNPTAPEVV